MVAILGRMCCKDKELDGQDNLPNSGLYPSVEDVFNHAHESLETLTGFHCLMTV